MTGYLINKGSKTVLQVVPDVISADDTEIIGQRVSLRGIDINVAGVIVTDATYQVGDVIANGEADKRGQLPKSTTQKIDELTMALADIYSGGAV